MWFLFTRFLGSCGNFCQIPEIVSLHLQVKHFTFCTGGLYNQMLVEQILQDTHDTPAEQSITKGIQNLS